MGLFRKKCEYCKNKIDKGKELFRDVKDPVFVGTREKAFCSEEHADSYEREMEEHMKKPRQGGGCCG